MKFQMNNLKWIIKSVKSEIINTNENEYLFGITLLDKQLILINNEVSIERQKQTLYHELMHCYLYCYTDNREQFSEEDICNISAKSHDIIHKIVEKYFKEK